MKINVLVTLLLSIFSVTAFAENYMVAFEEAIESSALEVRVARDLTGIVKGKRCDECEMVLVKVTPKTKLEIDGFKTPLKNANKCLGKSGLVIYKVDTREVRLISCER